MEEITHDFAGDAAVGLGQLRGDVEKGDALGFAEFREQLVKLGSFRAERIFRILAVRKDLYQDDFRVWRFGTNAKQDLLHALGDFLRGVVACVVGFRDVVGADGPFWMNCVEFTVIEPPKDVLSIASSSMN
jgi:hypothetical protein